MHSFFFFNDTATTEIYTLSLHDALPISTERDDALGGDRHLLQQIELVEHFPRAQRDARQRILSLGHREVRFLAQQMIRSEEHTSELQSRLHLVCRLLLEKKKTTRFMNAD